MDVDIIIVVNVRQCRRRVRVMMIIVPARGVLVFEVELAVQDVCPFGKTIVALAESEVLCRVQEEHFPALAGGACRADGAAILATRHQRQACRSSVAEFSDKVRYERNALRRRSSARVDSEPSPVLEETPMLELHIEGAIARAEGQSQRRVRGSHVCGGFEASAAPAVDAVQLEL